jgi:vacuolar-type H+-ATPase subunit H
VLTVVGALGVGLLGVMGVVALMRGRRAAIVDEAREKARTIVDRVSPELRTRARAVVQAARGKIEPVAA